MRSLVRCSIVALAVPVLGAIGQASVIYVNRAATGANNGTSWADAFVELRDALPTAGAGDQVWVAAGTYKPTPAGGSILARMTVSGAEVYGGFVGNETSLAQRNWIANETILSGDVNGDDGSGYGGADNSRRIVDVIGGMLDGVVISNGVAQMFAVVGHSASVRNGSIRHATFRRNLNGAVDLWTGGTVADSLFYFNTGSSWSVATMHEEESQSAPPAGPAFVTNCVFYDNGSFDGMVMDLSYWYGQTAECGYLTNTIAVSNNGLLVSQYGMDPTRVQGCLSDPPLPASYGIQHLSGDPRFVSLATLDFRLRPDSPCIDAGSNIAVADGATDMDGHPRRQEIAAVPNTGMGAVPIVDIGAYEVMADCNGNGAPDFEEIASGAAADANGNTILDTCEGGGSDLCLGDLTFGVACPCGNQSSVGGCSNSVNHGAVLTAFGQARVSDDSLALACSGMGANAPALYFQGDAIDAIYGPGGVAFGDGLRCVFGTIIRLGIKGSVNGSSMFGAGVGNDPHISVRGALPAPGGTRHYQVWYRDGANYCTPARFNTSNGLTIAWGA